MRTLSILRHAKSSWDDPALADFDRPLAARGLKAAPAMGRQMRVLGLKPGLVICSPARRTRETAALALDAFGGVASPIAYDERVYEAPGRRLVERLREVEVGVSEVLLIGHNPGLQELTFLLTGGRIPPRFSSLTEKLPTGSLLVFSLPGDGWSAIGEGQATLVQFITPRSLEPTGGR